jgi:ribosomal protein L3 glutamine methyltransferase
LAHAAEHLAPNGVLVVEIGTGREIIESEYPELPFLWLDTAESRGEVFALGRGDLPDRKEAAARPGRSRGTQ